VFRPGLRFTGDYRGGGYCGRDSEQTAAKSAVRCVWRWPSVDSWSPNVH